MSNLFRSDCIGAVLVATSREGIRLWQLRPGFERETDGYLIQKHPLLLDRLQRAEEVTTTAIQSLCGPEKRVFPSTQRRRNGSTQGMAEVWICNQGETDGLLSASSLFVREGKAYFNRRAEEIPLLPASRDEETEEGAIRLREKASSSERGIFRLSADEMDVLLSPASVGKRILLPVRVGRRNDRRGVWTFLNAPPLLPLPSPLPLLREEGLEGGGHPDEEGSILLLASVHSLVSLHPSKRRSLFDLLLSLSPADEEKWDRLCFALGLPSTGIATNCVRRVDSGRTECVRREIVYDSLGESISQTTDGVPDPDSSPVRRRDFFLPSSRREDSYLRTLSKKTAPSWFRKNEPLLLSTSDLLHSEMKEEVRQVEEEGKEDVSTLNRLRSEFDSLSSAGEKTSLLLPVPDEAVRLLLLSRQDVFSEDTVGVGVLVDRRFPDAARAALGGPTSQPYPTVDLIEMVSSSSRRRMSIVFDPTLSSSLQFRGVEDTHSVSSSLRRTASYVTSPLPTSIQDPRGGRRFVEEKGIPPPVRRVERGRGLPSRLPSSSPPHPSSNPPPTSRRIASLPREEAVRLWESV